jgi:tetratricopeptide (TPR) repeat protein
VGKAGRSEFATAPRPDGVFLNRDRQLDVLTTAFEATAADPRQLTVFEVVGLGGAGKSRLLRELDGRIRSSSAKPTIVWVSLVSEGATTEIGPLKVISDSAPWDCLLFETGLATYWAATGQPFVTTTQPGAIRTRLLRSGEIVSGVVAPVPLPLNFGVELFAAAKRRAGKARRYHRSEFAEIDELRHDPTTLRRMLPHLLGLDLERNSAVRDRPIVIFLDAYDRQSPATLERASPWLRELLGTLGRGMHVVSTREHLGWDPAAWGDVLRVVDVGQLPASVASLRIHDRLGPVTPEIEDRIVAASHRMPFHLESMLNAYEFEADRTGVVDVHSLPTTPEQAVERLLDHLQTVHRQLAIALAALQVFDRAVYEHLVRALHMQVSVVEFTTFTDWFFVENLGAGLYQVHDLLTEAVRADPQYDATKRAALGSATSYLLAATDGEWTREPSALLHLLQGVVGGWVSCDDVDTSFVEQLVDVGYRLYDAGYWNELVGLASTVPASGGVSTALRFLAALSVRRSAGTGAALDELDEVAAVGDRLGRHRRSVDLEQAYLIELGGNYALARQRIEELDEELAPVDPTDRTQVRARLYHADLLLMDGRFELASRLLLELVEGCAEWNRLDEAEARRHRGHCFRFSFDLDSAERHYRAALAVAVDSPAMVARLHTNLAEVACWRDEDGVAAARLAIDLNSRVGNRFEVAKAYVALAIALGRGGDHQLARAATVQAVAVARSVGYRAGELFALQGLALVEYLAGDNAALVRCVSDVVETIEVIGTYGHLAVMPAWLAGDDECFVRAAEPVDWLGPDDWQDRLAVLVPVL